MNVPLMDLKAQYAQVGDEIRAAVNTVLDEQTFIWGKEIKELEERMAAFCGTRHALGVASGSDALYLALAALGTSPGDEVITTPFTFFATAGAIAQLQAKPVFADIDPLTYNLDPAAVERALTPRSKALIPVHLYGQCADMEQLGAIARRARLALVEDAAQAIGAEYKGQPAGSMGDCGCFSFYPSKNLGGIGDGGMVVTNDDAAARTLHMLREHGSADRYYHRLVGTNSRLDTLQAAAILVKLKYLARWNERRREKAAFYRHLFTEAGLADRVVLPLEAANCPQVFHLFVVRAKRRDELLAFLRAAKIGCGVYYPLPLHLQECFSCLGYKEGDFPEAERAARETLALPMYPELTAEMQEHVVERVRRFYDGTPGG